MPNKPRKPHRYPTKKRMRLLNGIAAGMNVSEAGRAAGYHHYQSAHQAFAALQAQVPELIEKICPIEKILTKIASKLDAKETKFFAHQGIVTDQRDVIAHDIQLEAAQTMAKIAGLCDTNRRDKEPPESDPSVTISLDLLMSEEAGKILDVE